MHYFFRLVFTSVFGWLFGVNAFVAITKMDSFSAACAGFMLACTISNGVALGIMDAQRAREAALVKETGG